MIYEKYNIINVWFQFKQGASTEKGSLRVVYEVASENYNVQNVMRTKSVTVTFSSAGEGTVEVWVSSVIM